MPVEYLTPAIEDRAVAVQAELADRGQHRAASIPDLLVAATAELAQLIVLRLDKDFELISRPDRQPVERLKLEIDKGLLSPAPTAHHDLSVVPYPCHNGRISGSSWPTREGRDTTTEQGFC